MDKREKKIKVLQAVYCLGRGGAERLAIDITNELNKKEGVEALLVSFNKTADYEYSTSGVNYKYCHSEVKLSIFKKNINHLENYTNLIKEFNPDIIHTHRYLTEVLSREIIYPEITYFTHIHDNIEQLKKFSFATLFNKTKLLNFYEKTRIINRYHKCKNNFIAISKDTYNYAMEVLPKSLHNIHLLHNAISFNNFNANAHDRNINRNGEIKLLSIGNLLDKKNQIYFIDVIKILKDKGYNVVLDLLGAGVNFQMLSDKIKTANLQNNIYLRGNVENVGEYLFNSHIYVHSALYEPFGLVLLEAMAAGLPCVSLDGRGNRDFINNGVNGFMIFDSSPINFAERIIDLIENKILYDKIVENSIKTAKEYDISAYVDKLLNFYFSALQK